MTMETKRVKVVKAGLPSYWYADSAGAILDVYDHSRDWYVLKEDFDNRGHDGVWRNILKEDAEEVANEHEQMPKGFRVEPREVCCTTCAYIMRQYESAQWCGITGGRGDVLRPDVSVCNKWEAVAQ